MHSFQCFIIFQSYTVTDIGELSANLLQFDNAKVVNHVGSLVALTFINGQNVIREIFNGQL